MYYLGYDVGSSSVKAALVDGQSNQVVAVTKSPDTELEIQVPQPGWAEQHPDLWWEHLVKATRLLLAEAGVMASDIKAIGISYQMHGLVLVDAAGKALRSSIIWCDSRAVETGQAAFEKLGEDYSLEHLLNSPGNFTAAKLAWVKAHEPSVYAQAAHFMLPGDYLALRMTGELNTTITGLSEGIFWDFEQKSLATQLLAAMGLDAKMAPPVVANFEEQGRLSAAAAAELGLAAATPLMYRGGDQPNNALSLGVLEPGQVAATGGTSGVVYGVSQAAVFDPDQRVNSFAHVNYSLDRPLIGVLLCINGAGSLYRWVNQHIGTGRSYPEMEAVASQVAPGSEGLSFLPFGNGAERMLGNQHPGAMLMGLSLNQHHEAEVYRAALEGVAYAFVYGIEILKGMNIPVAHLRVGNDNLFQSQIFSQTIADLTGSRIEVVATTGAVGAARAAGFGLG
ncbi:MAG: FGGY family carbohydrate kinase, partial [Bacteroidota bacterium]